MNWFYKLIAQIIFMTLNYFEHLRILASAATECVTVFAFASLVGIFIEIKSSAVG